MNGNNKNGGLYITNKWLAGILVPVILGLVIWIFNMTIKSQAQVNEGVAGKILAIDTQIADININLALILQSVKGIERKLGIQNTKESLNKLP